MAGGGESGRVLELDAEQFRDRMAALWKHATDARRDETGLNRLHDVPALSALDRAGAFGAGVVEGETLVSAAVAMPALADDGRSPRVVPGMMHIASVATRPGRWGEGLGRRAVNAVLSQGKRRGYARTQLWTHAANPVSRHLYESMGFSFSGRTRVDDFGEDIVHYIRELTAEPVVPRPAARLLCCDPDDRVLLLHWRDPYDGFVLWEPPGGGIEPGETPLETVLREWGEETGLDAPAIGGEPVTVARDLMWLGDRYVGDEYFFLGRATSPGVPEVGGQTEIEQASYLGHRWLPWREIADLGGTDKPDVLAVLRRLDPNGPWAAA
jgi:8-oxo-dGTP pyrophosphatase MutT (NUDIX family)/GNAT superfamily N-acetyltransferase